jgi:hypothetical protein
MTGGFSFLLILLKNLYSKSPTCLRSWLLVFFRPKGKICDCCGRGKVRTKEERLDGIGISSYFCLAFAVNETYIGAKEQEAVPDGGIPPIRQAASRRSKGFAHGKRTCPHPVRKTPEKGISSSFEAFPTIQAEKAGKRANLGAFRQEVPNPSKPFEEDLET